MHSSLVAAVQQRVEAKQARKLLSKLPKASLVPLIHGRTGSALVNSAWLRDQT